MRKSLLYITCFILSVQLSAQDNMCLDFNGVHGYVKADHKALKLKKEITIEFWVQMDTIKLWDSPISYFQDNWINESGWGFAIARDKLRFIVFTDNLRKNSWEDMPGFSLLPNRWYHIAGTYDGTAMKSYLNGECIGVYSVTGNINWEFTPLHLAIGAFLDDDGFNCFDGRIDELKIWDVAKTEEEINQDMFQTVSNEVSGLVAYYTFDEGRGNILPDHGPNNIHGEFHTMDSTRWRPSMSKTRVKTLACTPKNVSSFVANWKKLDDLPNIDAYILDVARDKEFTNFVKGYKEKNVGVSTSCLVSNIEHGSYYYYRVRGYSKTLGESMDSKVMKVNAYAHFFNLSYLSDTRSIKQKIIHNGLIDNNIINIQSNEQLLFIYNVSTCNFSDVCQMRYKLREDLPWMVTTIKNGMIHCPELSSGHYKIKFQIGKNGKWDNIEYYIAVHVSTPNQFWILLSAVIVFAFSFIWVFRRYFYISVYKKEKTDKIPPEDKAIIDRLNQLLLEEKPHLESSLSMTELADKLRIKQQTLSTLLDHYYKQNFYDFINTRRIKEVKRLLVHSEYKQYTHTVLAEMSGFQSRASFYRVFKKYTGMTPLKFQKKNK